MRKLPPWAAILLAASCSRKPAAVQVDPALALLVPPDAVMLAGGKMNAIRGGRIRLVDDWARKTGLDLRRNLWEFLAVSDGRDTAVLLRGKFTPEGGLEPRLDLPGAQRTAYRGHTLIAAGDTAVAFTNATTAVAGPPEAVRRILDQRAGATGIPQRLLDEIKLLPPTCQLWYVTAREPLIAVGLDLRDDMATAVVVCPTESEAWRMHERLGSRDCCRVERGEQAVKLTARVPAEELERFLTSLR